MTDDEIDEKIRKTLSSSVPILWISFGIVVASLITNLFMLQDKDPYYWFQRSGALMVLLSAWVEYKLSQISGDINQPPSGYSAEIKYAEKYGDRYRNIQYVALGSLIAGTVIWGYGDIPFKAS